jgi:hypothetical protein
MTSAQVIDTIKLAVETGLVDPQVPMFDDAYANVWQGMIGDDWKDKVLLAIYEMAAKQVQIIDMAGPINPN